MNPRHAAALALVGWYLMAPPMSHHAIDANAPLSQWAVIGSYDTANECMNWLFELGHQDPKDPPWTTERISHARCISTDDPRLKEK